MLSKDVFLVGVATVFAGFAMTTASTTTSTTVNGIAYAASGTIDAKTAKMFNRLLQNSKHLQVQTQVAPSAASKSPASHIEISYKVSGTTDVETAKRLIELFRDNQHVVVIVDVHQKSDTFVTENTRNNFKKNMNQMAPAPIFVPNYPAVYVQSPNKPNYWYPVAQWKKVPTEANNANSSESAAE